MATAGQDTFTTASSWAWAHGLVGATATDGAVIASPQMAAETITAAAARQPIAAILHTATAAQPAATRRSLIPAERVQRQVTLKRSAPVPQRHTRHRLRTQRQLRTQLPAPSLMAVAAVN